MPLILHKWDTLITVTLNPLNVNQLSVSDESIYYYVSQSETEKDNVKLLLIEGVVDNPKIRDKQQFVQVNQAVLIRLLDKIYSYKQTAELQDKTIYLYNAISRHLEYTLNFIQDFFGNYFDYSEKVPMAYLLLSIENLQKQFEIIQELLNANNHIPPKLAIILASNFKKFYLRHKTKATYNELVYQKDLTNELLTEGTLASEKTIREALFYFNFNDDDYVAYEYTKLNALSESLDTKKEKIVALRLEQKNMNQLRTRLNIYLSSTMPSLKEQINQWIEEEIKFLEIDLIPVQVINTENELEDKIHTSLSVARLALLLRLMVIDKIITNRVVAHVLRITVKTVSTLQKENIAFGSLETKYHNPDRGTISAVKDMLFRWINILSKL